jgi:DNA-binding NarL/FixJ family response regulator
MTTRIVIADDQALVRGGLRMILDAQPDLEVVGEAVDGREALQNGPELQPDLVLMDVRMPELDGLETTRRLLGRDPSAKVLVLTTFDLDDYVYEAIRAGASGFLLKSAPPQQLVAGIRTVMAGDALLAPEITRRLLDRFVARPPAPPASPRTFADLSERELEVLRLIADWPLQRRNRRRSYISEATVKTHVTHILTKLRLRDRVQAVAARAYRTGLMGPATLSAFRWVSADRGRGVDIPRCNRGFAVGGMALHEPSERRVIRKCEGCGRILAPRRSLRALAVLPRSHHVAMLSALRTRTVAGPRRYRGRDALVGTAAGAVRTSSP